jgi:protein ImuB
MVTIHRCGQRMTIAAACPVAEALGLNAGMAVTQARALVPGLDVRDAEPAADRTFLTRLALYAARRWTPRAAVSGDDGLWLDLSGVTHLFGGEAALCRRILRFCARLGFDAQIAVAGTAGAAHALARYAAKQLVLCPSGDEAEAIAPLPLAALRLDDDLVSAALRLGIDRIGDLLAMPRGPLERRFGGSLLGRLDQALGRAGEAIDPIVPEEPPSILVGFVEPIATAEAIAEALRRLIDDLVGTLEKQGLAARSLLLRCSRIDGEEQRIAIGTARATRDGKHLFSLLAPRIETIEPGFGIEAMRLTARRCEPLGPLPIDGGLAGKRKPDLVPLVDRLVGRLGSRRLFRLSAVESDVPERSLSRVSPLGEVQAWPPHWPRPVRLLPRPEPIDKVVALLPDGPPRRFTWRGDIHVVRKADGPERIYGEWWKDRAEADAVRDYFQVEDEEGARFWIFRRGDGVDRRTGNLSWYLHGLFG